MKDYKELTKKIDTVIDAYTDELFAHNCDLADHPEISGEEYETSKKAVNLLKSHGSGPRLRPLPQRFHQHAGRHRHAGSAG